jgi:hypothetical protein
MKEYMDAIDWREVWEFSKHFILPNIGWLIFWSILFVVLGLIISIVLNVYLYRKNIFTRDKKYYNCQTLDSVYYIGLCLFPGNDWFILWRAFYSGERK